MKHCSQLEGLFVAAAMPDPEGSMGALAFKNLLSYIACIVWAMLQSLFRGRRQINSCSLWGLMLEQPSAEHFNASGCVVEQLIVIDYIINMLQATADTNYCAHTMHRWLTD